MIHQILPNLQYCMDELTRIEHGGLVEREGNRFVRPSLYSMRLCGEMKAELKKIEIYDLWLLGCFLFPYLRDMSFWHDVPERQGFIARAESLTRILCTRYQTEASGEPCGNSTSIQSRNNGASSAINDSGIADGNNGSSSTSNVNITNNNGDTSAHIVPNTTEQNAVVAEPVVKKRKFSLKDHAKIGEQSLYQMDEVSRYKSIAVSSIGLNHELFFLTNFLSSHFGTREGIHFLRSTVLPCVFSLRHHLQVQANEYSIQ